MKSRTLLALGAASIALLGYTVHLLGERKAARPRPAAAADAAPRPADSGPRARPGADDDGGARDALAIALRSRLERALDGPDEEPPLPIPETRVEAEAAFEVVMDSVERLADSGDKISKRRRQRLYRAANDAFAALSNHLDAQRPRDLAQLEEAHIRLKHMLGEIGAEPGTVSRPQKPSL